LFSPAHTYSQEYLAGTGVASIEPDRSLISLHLGGYGAPREGRFTLQWTRKEKLPELSAFSGSDKMLFIVSNGDLMTKDPGNNVNWLKAGKAENIISLSGYGNSLYALNQNGELMVSPAGKIRWKKVASMPGKAAGLTFLKGIIYAAGVNGNIWSLNLKSGTLSDFMPLENTISLASYGNDLYALTGDGSIFKCRPGDTGKKWLKAAYRNNITIKEDVRHIAFCNGAIYGISSDNYLLEGNHRSEGNLSARALALKNGDKTVILLNVDVCGMNDTYTGQIKKQITGKYGIPASAIFMNFSHTHFAPVSQNWLTWQEPNQLPDSIYLNSVLKNGILSATDKALNSLSPAKLYVGRGKTDIGYNRSLRDHQELYDSTVDVLKIKYADSESYLFLAACHAVFSTAGTLHYTISANFPGVARKLIEERTGTENSLFIQGTAGDINPADNGAYISGEKLANSVFAIVSKPMTELNGPISFFLDTINIPVEPWSREQIIEFREQNNKPGDVNAEKNVKWSNLMLKYLDQGTMPNSLPVYVHTINVGDWKLVGFSRETTTQYGFGVRQIWPGKMVSVAGYTNDVSSYLPTTLHIKAKNYEGLNSFFWYGMPNTFPEGVENLILGKVRELGR
jgi:hypothetical protein